MINIPGTRKVMEKLDVQPEMIATRGNYTPEELASLRKLDARSFSIKVAEAHIFNVLLGLGQGLPNDEIAGANAWATEDLIKAWLKSKGLELPE